MPSPPLHLLFLFAVTCIVIQKNQLVNWLCQILTLQAPQVYRGGGPVPLKLPLDPLPKGRVYKPMKLGTLWKQGRRRQRERSKKIDLMSCTTAKHVCFTTFSFLRRRSRKINYIFRKRFNTRRLCDISNSLLFKQRRHGEWFGFKRKAVRKQKTRTPYQVLKLYCLVSP